MKMKRTIALSILMAISLLTSPVFAGDAENGKISEIERTIAVQRATEIAIWAMPAVTTYGFVRGSLDIGGKLNDVVALSQPLTSRHGFLTSNDVTPYVIGSLTTADGPNYQVR
jgi:hypothetical protein